jgi:hypothetical protein
VIWDIPILRKPPVRLAQPGVNGSANKNNPVKVALYYGGTLTGFSISDRIA